jgi:hypothetical protein
MTATDIIFLLQEKKKYSYTLDEVKRIVKSVWTKIRLTVHQRFNDGLPTCTFATYEVGKSLKKNKIRFRVASGEYSEGTGHWWVVLYAPDDEGLIKKWIVDLGNNIEDKSIRTGKIKPINCIPYRSQHNYNAEDFMDFEQALPIIAKY